MSRNVFTFSNDDIAKFIDELINETLSEVETGGNEYTQREARSAGKTTDNDDACPMCCATTQREMIYPKLFDYIDRVISQESATIIFWKDGTKTTAKCGKDDTFDYEKGLAIAALKYVFGNKVYQEDMKTLMEAYPRTKSSAKKKIVEKTETKKTSTSKKSSSSKSKSANKKSTTTKKTSNKKSNDDIPF